MARRIRIFDWAATPLGSIDGWSERLKLMVEQVLASPLVATLVCGPERVLIYNEAAARLYGDRHPRALGRPLPATFPEGWATVAPFYARAFAGETVHVTDQPLDTRGEGRADDAFDALLTPVREADGRIAHVHMTGAEIGARARTEAALRESEARYRRLVETMNEGFVVGEFLRDDAGTPVDFRYLELNPALERLSGLKVDETVGRWITDVLPPEDARYWIDAFGSVVTSGTPARFEHCVGALDRWFGVNVTPIGPNRIATIYENITERKRAEAALRDGEKRLRALVAASSYAVYRMSSDWRRMHRLDGHDFLADTNAPDEGWADSYILPDDRDVVFSTIAAAIRDRRMFELEHRVRRADGSVGWTLSRAVPILDDDGEITEWIGAASDVTGRKAIEASLRASQERQAFLLRLTDALRPLGDPVATQEVATRMLGTELRVDRCYYAEFDWPRDVLHIAREYVGSASFSVVGEHPISAFQDLLVHSHKGEPLVCDDIAAHPVFKSEIAAYRERGTDGFILIPLVKQGVMVACMCVTMSTPRAWSAAEVELVREVGDRTWEAAQRIRAEGAMKESEERFRQFANAASGALWMRDAATLRMEYVSPAIARIYGVEPGAFLNGVEVWASAIIPEDREAALEHLERARGGESVVHEFRVQRPEDGSFRWIRNTDFPLRDAQGRVQRIGGIAEDVTEAKLATEHTSVLLAELQHRVRNIMALIRSITARTGERAESVPEYAALMAGRLMTFARVQALLTRAANVGVALTDVVPDELAAQAGHEGQYALDGPDVILSPKAAEVLTLAVHELATNALKYGGLSVPGGRVAVCWGTFERRGAPWLGFDWIEAGAPGRLAQDPSAPRRRGFGSELIEGRIPYELGGRGRLDIAASGACCRLEFPLRKGASILETDAPRRATVFGGAIAMASEVDLGGQRILVVEDDYFLASDTARALQGCGAEVLGPYPTEKAARDEIAEEAPTGAVLDLDLGEGASFALAADLRARGVPFVIVTGYDEAIVPSEYAAVPLLQKPVHLRQVVSALATALGAAA